MCLTPVFSSVKPQVSVDVKVVQILASGLLSDSESVNAERSGKPGLSIAASPHGVE